MCMHAVQEDIEKQNCIHIALHEASGNLEPAVKLVFVVLHYTLWHSGTLRSNEGL